MDKHIKTTRKGDRQRHRQAVQRRPAARPLEGNHLRVRGVRRKEIDATKLSLAFWMLAQHLVEDQTDAQAEAPEPDESEDSR